MVYEDNMLTECLQATCSCDSHNQFALLVLRQEAHRSGVAKLSQLAILPSIPCSNAHKSVGVQALHPWVMELCAHKTWRRIM